MEDRCNNIYTIKNKTIVDFQLVSKLVILNNIMVKTLTELKKMLGEHYLNEVKIMNEIHDSKLSSK